MWGSYSTVGGFVLDLFSFFKELHFFSILSATPTVPSLFSSGKVYRVAASTKVKDIIALACSTTFALYLMVWKESFYLVEPWKKSTPVPFEPLDSLFDIGGVSLGSLSLEISFCSFVRAFDAIVPLWKKVSINIENILIGLVNVLKKTY